MVANEAVGLLVGAVGLGAVHGIEPGHGWPVAASYALERSNKWLYGFAASAILGIGHLVSSIAMVAAFFYAKTYFDLAQVDRPLTVFGGVEIGGPVSVVAGVVLIGLGIREYFHGHSHSIGSSADDEPGGGEGDADHDHHDGGLDPTIGLDHGHEHGHPHGHHHEHSEHGHEQGHGHAHDGGVLARVRRWIPFAGGGHSHADLDEGADRGLFGIAWFAFLLGFAHEEEFEIIALCAGSDYCLELMSAYALTVILGIVGLTMALIAGYEHFEERVERFVPYLPAFSATVLIAMGLGFVTGVL